MFRTASARLASIVSAAVLALCPSPAQAQKALVYCPVGIDATGCNAVVAALAADATRFPDGADAGYDGTQGTVDLAGADLSGYSAFIVPSLADGPDAQPYSLLRNGTIAGRLHAAFMGRVAVWSGTPDVGTTNRGAKDNLLRNLAAWAKADAAGSHGPGLVALQDNSDDPAARYGWLGGITQLRVTADTTLDVYSNVQVLTTTGQAILTSGGLQIGYTNMASYGLLASGASNDATGGRSARVVLVSAAGEPSDPTRATVTTDREDYAPGDTVIVTGRGWEPGESVMLLFHEEVDPPIHPDRTLTTVADPDGRISNAEYAIDEEDVNVRFVLTATGQTSGQTAQTTFTDGNKTSFSTTATGAEVTDFGTINVNQCVVAFVQARQGGALDAETGTVALTSSPAGATFFSGGTCAGGSITSVTFANETAKPISFRFAATGSFTLKGDGPWSNNSNDASAAVTVKQAQTIAFTSTAPSTAVVGGTSYTAAATATSGLTVTFSSLTPTVCTSGGTNGATITPIAVGTCTVAADQAGNTTFNAAPRVSQSYAVGKGNQTITFTSTAPSAAAIGGPTYTATATATSGLTVTFSSLTTGVCTSSGSNGATITFVGGGTCTVAADQAGNANYNPATQVTQTFSVGKKSQTISFDLSTLSAKTFGDADFSVAGFASASSGLTVSFSSGSPARCTVGAAGLVHIITAGGNCTVVASQPGDATYNPAADVTQAFNVAKAGQAITITSTAPAGAIVGGPTYTVAATASSGLTVVFSSLTTGVCTSSGTNGATITFVGGGTCTVAANQAGNGDYNAAPQVTQSFSVSAQAPQTISFTSTAPGDAVFGGTYSVSATATSGLPVVLSSQTTGVCTVATGTVSFVGVGTCTVAADQPGNASFLAAPQVTQSFAVGKADQTIAFGALADKTYGNPDFGVGATASSGLAVSFAASGQCSVSTATVHLTGAGSCTITASQPGNGNYNAAPSVPRAFTIHGAPVAPVITAANKTYDGTTAATIVTRNLSGIVGSDDVSLIDGTAAFADKHVGTGKTVTGSGFGLAGAAAGNYVLSPTTATAAADIEARAITVTATTDSREYDGTANSSATPAVTLGEIQTGDAAAFTQSFDTKNVGTGKTLTPAGAVTDGNGGLNYTVSFQPVTTGVITAKALTGHITAKSKPYDGSDAAEILSRTLTGVIGTEHVSYAGGTATFDNRNAGTGKTVTATGLGLTGPDAGNYTVNATATATADIERLPITVTAVSDTKTYDGTTTSSGAPAVSGNTIIAPDTPNFSQTFDTKNVGSGKTLTPSGSVNDGNGGNNYQVAFAPVSTGKINPRALTVSATATPKTYDGNTDAVVTLSDDRVAGDELTLDYGHPAHFDDRNAGTGKSVSVDGIIVGGGDAGNYTFNTTATAMGTILRRKIAVTAAADTRAYNGTTGSSGLPTITYGSLVSGETATWTQAFDSKHAGSRTLTPAGSVSDGNGGNNYEVTFKTAGGAITLRDLTVSATGQNKVYDATDAATVTLGDDRLAGDLFALGYASAHFSDKNVGTGKAVSVSGIAIVTASGPEAGDYQLTGTTTSTTANITKAPLVVSATGVNKIFDGNTSATVTLSATPLLSDVLAPLTYATASFATPAAGLNKPVSVTGISLGGADGGNYSYNTTAATTANVTYFTGAGHLFLQPVNLPPQQRSAFKINSTIPVKFQIFLADGITPVSGVVASISTLKLSSTTLDAVNEDVVSTVPDQGTSFRYDPSGKLYIFNLGTKTWTAGTYRIIATLDDGSTITAEVEARAR